MTNLNLIVLRALLSKTTWHGLSHVVSVDLFPGTEYRRLYKIIAALHKASEHDVELSAVRAAVEIEFDRAPDARDSLLSMIELVDETRGVPEDSLQHLVNKFIVRAKVFAVAEYAITHVEQEDFDVHALKDIIDGAVDFGAGVGDAVVDIFEAGLSGSRDDRPARTSLGLSRKLDDGLRGGTGPGELCLLLAPPAVGKTSLVIQSGANHARKGGRVLHVTLEINTRKVIERYNQAWTALTSERLATPEGQERCAESRRLVKAAGGQVHVIDYSYMPVTAGDIGALVRKLKAQGNDIDLVIVDYLGLMHTNKPMGREMRASYAAVGKEMRALAHNLNVPILTAWQVNREGADRSNFLLSARHVSESWDIIMIADTIIGLNQNEEELRRKTMRLNIIKQRESTDRSYFEVYCDLDRMVIRDLEERDAFSHVQSIIKVEEAETDIAGDNPVAGDQTAESRTTSGAGGAT